VTEKNVSDIEINLFSYHVTSRSEEVMYPYQGTEMCVTTLFLTLLQAIRERALMFPAPKENLLVLIRRTENEIKVIFHLFEMNRKSYILFTMYIEHHRKLKLSCLEGFSEITKLFCQRIKMAKKKFPSTVKG
jgi:hypothetical protein